MRIEFFVYICGANTIPAHAMSDIVPIPSVKRFDLNKEPIPVKWYLRPITWLISFPIFWLHRSKIKRIGMEGLKAPYIQLCNHNAFYDFMARAIPTEGRDFSVEFDFGEDGDKFDVNIIPHTEAGKYWKAYLSKAVKTENSK